MKGTRIPEDFQPSEKMVEWAINYEPAKILNLERELLKFQNYWENATRNATKINWQKTWQNWVLNAIDYATPYYIKHGKTKQSNTELIRTTDLGGLENISLEEIAINRGW
jgi:hypothetical protein